MFSVSIHCVGAVLKLRTEKIFDSKEQPNERERDQRELDFCTVPVVCYCLNCFVPWSLQQSPVSFPGPIHTDVFLSKPLLDHPLSLNSHSSPSIFQLTHCFILFFTTSSESFTILDTVDRTGSRNKGGKSQYANKQAHT